MARDRVEVVDRKGCSKFLASVSPSTSLINGSRSSDVASLVTTSSRVPSAANGPFAGLVICVTGLSKEARKQVMAATERLGGQYSSSLHPRCTHLIVQSIDGRKFEHAMKHGLKNRPHVVTLGWFIDSVRKNSRLSETLYGVRTIKENGFLLRNLNPLTGYVAPEMSCIPVKLVEEDGLSSLTQPSDMNSLSCKESRGNRGSALSNEYIYIDSNVSVRLKNKVVDALTSNGAKVLEHWFVGCPASHVVCEGPHIQRYLGYANSLVTPLWILKTVKENCLHRLVHLSNDLARQVAALLENAQKDMSLHRLVHLSNDLARQVAALLENAQGMVGLNDTVSSKHLGDPETSRKGKNTLGNPQTITDLPKFGVRNWHHLYMQPCQAPLHPGTPSSLLDSICWSISDPISSARIYTDVSLEPHASLLFDAQAARDSKVSFDNFSRPLKECEKIEIIFKNHFLSVLFPIDCHGILGPSSRTYYSECGFTCVQVLDIIFSFYQENMSADEVAVAIHTDSRHGDRLRSVCASKESMHQGFVSFKRIDFLGSRRSFKILKQVAAENNGNVYELILWA